MYENGLQNLILKNVKRLLELYDMPLWPFFWSQQHYPVYLAFSPCLLPGQLIWKVHIPFCTFLVLKPPSSKSWASEDGPFLLPLCRIQAVILNVAWLGLRVSFYDAKGQKRELSLDTGAKMFRNHLSMKLGSCLPGWGVLCQHRCQRMREASEGSNWQIR